MESVQTNDCKREIAKYQTIPNENPNNHDVNNPTLAKRRLIWAICLAAGAEAAIVSGTDKDRLLVEKLEIVREI